jgi:hypothetical protein
MFGAFNLSEHEENRNTDELQKNAGRPVYTG